MQLDTFYCETVGGVFCSANNSYPSLEDLKITEKGSSLEIMSLKGIDRKRKSVSSPGNNDRETRNDPDITSVRVQENQDSEDIMFADNDEFNTTKKAKSRKPSKTEKNENPTDTLKNQMLRDDNDELSSRDQQIINKNNLEFCRNKIHSDKDENKTEDMLTESNQRSDIQNDQTSERDEMEKKQDIEFKEKGKSNAEDKDVSDDFTKAQKKFNIEKLIENEDEGDGKSSSSCNLPYEDFNNICASSSNNFIKRSNIEEIRKSFSLEKICDSNLIYDTNLNSNPVVPTVNTQYSPSVDNKEHLAVNNNENIESAPNTSVEGCAANSKFNKFPNVMHKTSVEPQCDIANERASEKNNYQFSEQTYYKDELDKGNISIENKNLKCSETSWENIQQNQSYSDNTEQCCFRVNHSRSNVDSNAEVTKHTEDNNNKKSESYTNHLEQAYVHQQHKSQKEIPSEDVTDAKMICNKHETNQLQSEHQIQQENFLNLSMQPTSRHQPQSEDEHYRQFQFPNQRSSYEQIFETDQSAQQNKERSQHSQHYAHEQFYQMRFQQQHPLGHVMPHTTNIPQQLPNLQDSLQEDHLMAYLHHQAAMAGVGHQSRLQQDIYQDLMMDEFHEDANPSVYKLRHLSPTTTKHENQDDGYETSAADVLTPNSHSSSTLSGTPQLSIHAPTSSLAVQNITSTIPTTSDQQRAQIQQAQVTNTQSSMNTISSENFNQDVAININQDLYKFTENTNTCLNNKIERLYPMPTEQQQQPNPRNQNPPNHTIHRDNIGNIKSDMADIVDTKGISESLAKPPQKRRGRKKKIVLMEGMSSTINNSNMNTNAGSEPLDGSPNLLKMKERKKHDRFNGMSEEEVGKRTLPDHLCHNLDIVIIGINPGLFAAYKGHHYAGPGNHFWKCLYLSGLTQEQMSADEDYKLMKCGIGFTNMVQRATKGSADLTRKEIKEGSRILLEKLQRFQPKIAVFNGKLIFEVFSGKKDFNFGRQPDCVEGTNTYIWVMPSSSARCAQLPRAADKVPFYSALKKFRDYLNGLIPQIDEAECVFTEQRIRQMCEQEQLKNLSQSQSTCSYGNVIDCTPNSGEKERQTSGDFASFSNNDNHLNAGTLNVMESNASGPSEMVPHCNGYLVPQNFSEAPHQTPEKKKRGRPKKLRIQEVIDPNTGQKIQITNVQHQHQQQHSNVNDFDIINLSMISGEIPKKKRGRPKKVKTSSVEIHPAAIEENSAVMLSAKQPLTSAVPQQHPQQISLYNNTPNSSLNQIYGVSVSPNPKGSPSLNTTNVGVNNNSVYTLSNNGNSAQVTPPTNETSNDLGGGNKQNISESSPAPSSPNICAVDFEQPSSSEHRSIELHSQQLAAPLQQQRPRYESSHISADNGTSENFHQWMSPSHQFSYQVPIQQDNQQSYRTEHDLSIHHRSQKQIHENHQRSPLSPWTMSHQNQQFESNDSNRQQQQQQQQHYINSMHHQQQQMQQREPQQLHQHSTDVSTKSLSGLESLVDQIPTIAESEAAAAAVESRLQTLQRSSTPVTFGDLQSENYDGNLMNENRGSTSLGNSTNVGEVTNDALTSSRNSSNGSNFGMSSATSCGSPINQYGLQRHGQASAASSPHAHSAYSGIPTFPINSRTNQHSPNASGDLLTNSHTPPTITNSSTTTNTTTSHHLFSNFSVSHLAASSVTPCSSNNDNSSKTNDWQSNGARSPYHHPNLMAAAALQLHTSSNSPAATPPHQMYIDPHASIHHHPHHPHLSSAHQHHVQVNSLYSSATSASHTHHHPAMAVTYGAPPPTSQHHVHNAGGDYGAYGATAVAAAAAHMLHMPNPNYSPYGYGTAPPAPVPVPVPVPTATSQNTYSTWNHHGHPTASNHHPHHLSMFERLKPSDIGSYTGF